MPKIILLNPVNEDGMGDFQHYLDIYKALKINPTFKDYEFISLIACYSHQISYIQNTMKTLGLDENSYFLGVFSQFHGEFLENKTLIQHFIECEQIIHVSYNIFPSLEKYIDLNRKALYKFIPEHEYGSLYAGRTHQGAIYSLGLGQNCLGLKLDNISRISPEVATSNLRTLSPDFATALLTSSNSPDMNYFHEHNHLVPAYFNKMSSFVRFLFFLAVNNIPENKDLAIYVSGAGLRDEYKILKDENINTLQDIKIANPWLQGVTEFAIGFQVRRNIFKNTNIKQIVLAECSHEAFTIEVNPNGNRKLYIFYGYSLDNETYRNLYRQAPIAGVSGDNTLELAISCQVLPWYHSTNSSRKLSTYSGLIDIINKLEIDDDTKSNYTMFFSKMNAWGEGKYDDSMIAKFKQLDLYNMIESWSIISKFIINNHNFYNKLEGIVLDGLLVKENNAQPTSKIDTDTHKNSGPSL